MMNFGGPLLGIFACNSNKFLRQMPGRIIGMTTSSESNERAFCMVLQTREQHIRRERATSNVCTNEALCAVAAAAYLSLLGPTGLKNLCETIITKSHYTIKKLDSIDGIKAPLINSKHFKEFTVNFDKTNLKVEEIHRLLLGKKIHGGKNIKNDFPELGETSLFCVTETHSQKDIDKLVSSLNEIIR
jgi:glycine dehydrogenase subunit 1